MNTGAPKAQIFCSFASTNTRTIFAMSTLRALLVQAQLRWHEPERNREHLQSLLDASYEGADLAVLPETFTTGFLGDGSLPDEGMDGSGG